MRPISREKKKEKQEKLSWKRRWEEIGTSDDRVMGWKYQVDAFPPQRGNFKVTCTTAACR